jgi:Zn-finger nucleic acid-binding protein
VCRELLVSAVAKDVRILSCPQCRGNLIAQSKMLPILRQARKPDTSASEDPQPIPNKSELKRVAVCPSCQKKMEAYPYGGPGNVIIQGCDECRLIWLDFGELSQIIRSYSQMYDRSAEELGAKKKWIQY